MSASAHATKATVRNNAVRTALIDERGSDGERDREPIRIHPTVCLCLVCSSSCGGLWRVFPIPTRTPE